MRRLLLIVSVVVSVASVGCKSQCRQLSEKLCDCTTSTADRDTCLRRASNNEGQSPPTANDEARCKELVSQCDCRLIDTTEGKIRCGLAWPLDGGI